MELTHGQVIEVLVANREPARQAAAARGESKDRRTRCFRWTLAR